MSSSLLINHNSKSADPTAERDIIEGFVSEIGRGPGIAQQYKLVMSNYMAKYGYSSYVFARISNLDTGENCEYYSVSTLEQDWMDYYLANKLYVDDLIAQYLLVGHRPLQWRAVVERAHAGEMDPKNARVVKAAARFGVHNGVTIPLNKVGRFVAGISLIADADISVSEQERIFSENYASIITMVHLFNSFISQGEVAIEHYGLTKREVEVLKWAADGHLAKEIAAKLKTSYHTVTKQIASAQRRLGASNLAEAVAKAVMLNIID